MITEIEEQVYHPLLNLVSLSALPLESASGGLKIWYGVHETPLGDCWLATTARGICNLSFIDTPDPTMALAILRHEWPQAELMVDRLLTQELIDRVFQAPSNNSMPIDVCVRGTDFQMQVWRALLTIPWGQTTTYQDLAQAIDRPSAARAVGNAVGRNPVAFLIPCHRVIRASGILGGYRWGLERKQALLAWEARDAEN